MGNQRKQKRVFKLKGQKQPYQVLDQERLPRLQQPESKIWVRTEPLLSIHRKRTIFHYVSLSTKIGNYQQVLSKELAQSSKVQQKPLRVHQAQGSSPESLGHSALRMY